MPPAPAHLAWGMWNTAAAKTARQIFHQAATIIIVKPILQIMQTRKIFAGAFPAAIAVDFDVMQQTFRSPIRFRLAQHPGKAEGDFEKGPAIHSLKNHRSRLDPAIDFKGKMFIT